MDSKSKVTSDKGQLDENKAKRVNTGGGNQGFLLAASPPKFIGLEQLMKASNGVTNMVLAHEIAVNKDFKLECLQPLSDSIEHQVKDVVHQAFWDVFKEEMMSVPPNYNHAIKLLEELREGLLSLLLPQHTKIKTQICDVLDIDLIRQQAEHEILDFTQYSDFIISVMAKLCAPVRDEEIRQLMSSKELVPLFRGIFKLLDLMKLDMANFTIMQFRPHIQQQSIEYEQKKFQEFLETQEDGLKFTHEWLKRNADNLFEQEKSHQQNCLEASPENNNFDQLSPSKILSLSYMELLEWNDDNVFPETLLMDQARFLELRDKVEWLSLIAAILLVMYNTVGSSLYGIQDFKQKIKEDIKILLEGIPTKNYPSIMENISEQVVKEIDVCLKQHNFQLLSEAKQNLLKGQILEVVFLNHPVRKLLYSRVLEFIQQVTTSPTASPVKIPPGLTSMEQELANIAGQFLRLISHNRSVFGSYYSELIASITQDLN